MTQPTKPEWLRWIVATIVASEARRPRTADTKPGERHSLERLDVHAVLADPMGRADVRVREHGPVPVEGLDPEALAPASDADLLAREACDPAPAQGSGEPSQQG